MPLSDEEKRKCRLYLDVHEVSRTGMFVGGLPYSDIAQIVELALVICMANFTNRFNNGLRLEPDLG